MTLSSTTSVADRWRKPIIAIALILPSLATWIYFFQAANAAAGVQLLVYNVVKALQFLLPAVWFFGVQRDRPVWYSTSGRSLLIGAAFGLAVAGAMAAVYVGVLRDAPWMGDAIAQMKQKVQGFGIDAPWKYAALGVFYSLCHSLLEEYYWRWFVFGQLTRIASLRTAVLVSSLGFMAHHILVLGKFFGFASGATWLFSLSVAVGGVAWAMLYHASRALWAPWLSHLIVDAAIFTLGYFLVSDLWL
ncbi:MAG: CPBP family intramembrane metalloprotease [Planctomycetales bacterium]|nr:CPBP family intramembrane metalloprotease [Planctomycetales bacterium]